MYRICVKGFFNFFLLVLRYGRDFVSFYSRGLSHPCKLQFEKKFILFQGEGPM